MIDKLKMKNILLFIKEATVVNRRLKSIPIIAFLLVLLLSSGWSQTDENKNNSNKIESGFIQVDNGSIFYEKTGQGNPIVMIHDGLVHRETWNHQFPAWSTRYMLIRYDRRGFGKSPAPTVLYSNIDDLLAVMDSLGIAKATLIGLSAGSQLAIDFTLEHQERVSHLIVCGAVVTGMPFTFHLFTRGGRVTGDILKDTTKLYHYWSEVDPYEIYEGNTQARAEMIALLRAYPNDFAQLSTPFAERPKRQAINYLNEIKVPTLVITGEYDIPDVQAHSGAISAGIPGAERIVVSNAGHRVPMEQPEIYKNIVWNFLSESNFFRVLYQSGAEKAVEMFHTEQSQHPDVTLFSEARLNQVGYQYLLSGNISEAVLLFKLNVEAYPNSANVYDSYGEVLLSAGDTTAAMQNYKKSLELNPDNTNAKTILEQLRNVGK